MVEPLFYIPPLMGCKMDGIGGKEGWFARRLQDCTGAAPYIGRRGPSHDAAAQTHIHRHMDTCTGTGTHEPPTMHPHDAHLSGSDVRPKQLPRLSVVRAVRSPSLRASERQSHSARAKGGGAGVRS